MGAIAGMARSYRGNAVHTARCERGIFTNSCAAPALTLTLSQGERGPPGAV